MDQDLFSEFEGATKSDWIRQVLLDFKGQVVPEKLGSILWDSIPMQPIYNQEDVAHGVKQGCLPAPSLFSEITSRQWVNCVTVLPNDTNATILEALENGADGLILPLQGTEDLQELLKDVWPQYLSIYLIPLGNPLLVFQLFQEWLDCVNVKENEVRGGLLWSPADLFFDQKQEFGLGIALLEEILELTEGYPHFKAFCITTSRYSESGAQPVDALVYGLGELVEILDRISYPPRLVFQKLFLETAIGDHHFGEIARQKAFRQVVQKLALLYQVTIAEEDLLLFCKTAHWSQSLVDVHTNTIRQTYQALSAILGGVNVLWVRPLEEEDASNQERRIARNVSTLLKEEAFLDKVHDPSAGSYFLENLVVNLVQETQAGLVQLEQEGGWLKLCQSGTLQDRVKNYRAKIQGHILDKISVKVGVNSFTAPPALSHNKPFRSLKEAAHELKPTRAAYLVERLILDAQ